MLTKTLTAAALTLAAAIAPATAQQSVTTADIHLYTAEVVAERFVHPSAADTMDGALCVLDAVTPAQMQAIARDVANGTTAGDRTPGFDAISSLTQRDDITDCLSLTDGMRHMF